MFEATLKNNNNFKQEINNNLKNKQILSEMVNTVKIEADLKYVLNNFLSDLNNLWLHQKQLLHALLVCVL